MSLRHAVLIALHNGEGTGYEITKWFDAGMGYFWAATHQQIYLELRKMVEAGLVTFTEMEQIGKPAKKIYALTEEGMFELKRWLETPVKQCARKDALLMKIYSGHLIATDKLLSEMKRQLAETDMALNKFLEIEQQFFSDPDTFNVQQHFVHLTLRNGIVHSQASLNWCNEVINFLQSQKAHPPE